jgi:hypothetical protein
LIVRDADRRPSWWEYFGSFGNDIFGDDDTDDGEPSRGS